ncbi:unnamed protein product [Spirodela intermedia]|uniref:Uncharacterized protein n=1 Tax=Spirodela intermedia TaxID=51605 RepID=A0A7I8LL80_SPIIN|nr:unnamed protein product [Spirodela intermedia]
MGDYTISISSKLISRLAGDEDKQKRKTKKPKPKSPQEAQARAPQASDGPSKPSASIGLPPPPPLQQQHRQPLFLPIPLPPPPAANAELEAIRAVVQESEQAVERLQKKEAEMIQELTERAKELHEKEFKLPRQKPMPCLEEKDACLECYREHAKDPLRCARAVKSFNECARRAQQQMN